MSTTVKTDTVEIPVAEDTVVQGRVCTPEWWPSGRRVGVVIAHDAEGNLDQPNLVALQHGLAERGHLALAFNFPYAQSGRKRPDPQPLLERSVRVAAASLMGDAENAPARLVLVGFGLGARVVTGIVAQGLKVEGLVCLGFPLHPSGKPNQQKAEALYRIICPMLFVQGSRDAHCRVDRLEQLLRSVGAPTRLKVIEDCGQGLELIRKTDRTPEEIWRETFDAVDAFVERVT